MLTAVFALDPGQNIVIEAPGITLIAQLTEVLPALADNPDFVQIRARINDDTAQSIALDALAAFTRALEVQAGISLNQAALNAVHARFPGTGSGFVPTQN